jgi:ribosomal protein S18 acetylase RimI-like enzyme
MADEPRILVRVAEPEDAAATAAVRWSVGWTEPPAHHGTWPEADADWQVQRYFREMVAEADGVIIGRIGLEAYRQPFAELMDLSVRADYRRRGYGETLTMACHREAARRGFRILFLQTELDNIASQRLYTKLGFVPTAHGKMLRMVKFIDYPLLVTFLKQHPLSRYTCVPVFGRPRAWNLEWHAYVMDDYLRFCLEGGATQSDSEGVGPALSALDWSVQQGTRSLSIRLTPEPVVDVEPGHYVELEILLRNSGTRTESGVFQMLLPPGVSVTSPSTHTERTFAWEAGPGEEIKQPVVVRVDPTFDTSVLWDLNYKSLSICMETYWEGNRALLSACLPMVATPPD